jgi:hypothetical protein
MILSSDKSDRMAGATCSRAVLAACTDAKLAAACSTALTTKKAGYWALTTVKPTKGVEQFAVFNAIASSARVPAADVLIEGSLIGRTVRVWWKIKR